MASKLGGDISTWPGRHNLYFEFFSETFFLIILRFFYIFRNVITNQKEIEKKKIWLSNPKYLIMISDVLCS